MAYYAAEDYIGHNQVDGSIEITDDQFYQALEALGEGCSIAIRDSELRFLKPSNIIIYNILNKETSLIAENDDLPSDHTSIEPPSEYHIWSGDDWIMTEETQGQMEHQQKIATIIELEAKQTPRRIREAALGIDNGWLEDLQSQILQIRAEL